ncbi:hypothetical protein AT4G35940 [Arabidopsis thaliana]|jgi:hypothetical protein|uniref:Uncharacterized protein n=1 Tax=Arabidopsis thaliana TaxID=3702 RepID=A0A1P8B979_ARATH|nr:uncharacterized protein AT4G35940 [Arabidopsis thaliana]ANM68147.1 hypothetical protein AT4G35940 [Arabidopsis thaliana]|eukprot:NP_001329924.1 hypothetical protein AT4G35940 [Arabidopsis thaliana]
MSRCFPFPPPGYVLNGIRDEAVIVSSIKGVEEKAKKEQRRKDRRSDKKDKKDKKERKEKKEKKEKKRKEREGKEVGSEKRSHKRRRKEDGAKVDLFHKLKESEVNCLEKSSLTVERELLQSTSQNSCDSTLNSNEMLPKQKEVQQPLDGRHNNNNNEKRVEKQQPLDGRHNNNNEKRIEKQQPLNGRHNNKEKQKEKQQPLDVRHNNNDSESIIRIRLPIRRQKDPEVMMTNKDQEKPGPSRGIKLDSSQLPTREPVNQHPCSTSAAEHASKPREEKRKDPIFRGKHGKEKISSSSTRETYQPPKSLCNCPPSMVLQFLDVVENWVPNTIERRVDLINSEDEECWWSMKKPPSSTTEICKQLNRENEIKQVGNTMGWPCARLLPEADVYALPYTVPF